MVSPLSLYRLYSQLNTRVVLMWSCANFGRRFHLSTVFSFLDVRRTSLACASCLHRPQEYYSCGFSSFLFAEFLTPLLHVCCLLFSRRSPNVTCLSLPAPCRHHPQEYYSSFLTFTERQTLLLPVYYFLLFSTFAEPQLVLFACLMSPILTLYRHLFASSHDGRCSPLFRLPEPFINKQITQLVTLV